MYRPGEWKAICDVCGFEFLASKLREDWRGLRVCDKDWETRHPQEFVRPRPEKPGIPWSRPDDNESDITVRTESPCEVTDDPFPNIVYYNFDAEVGGEGTVQIPDVNTAVPSKIEFTLLLVNTGVNSIGRLIAAGDIYGNANDVMLATSTTRLRAIPSIESQGYWIRET